MNIAFGIQGDTKDDLCAMCIYIYISSRQAHFTLLQINRLIVFPWKSIMKKILAQCEDLKQIIKILMYLLIYKGVYVYIYLHFHTSIIYHWKYEMLYIRTMNTSFVGHHMSLGKYCKNPAFFAVIFFRGFFVLLELRSQLKRRNNAVHCVLEDCYWW